MSIVEFVDMEKLAAALHQVERWSFFVTVAPMNIVSGIASPPNITAVI